MTTGGSWSTCMIGANKSPPQDVAHLQFKSRVAFKLVWSPPTFNTVIRNCSAEKWKVFDTNNHLSISAVSLLFALSVSHYSVCPCGRCWCYASWRPSNGWASKSFRKAKELPGTLIINYMVEEEFLSIPHLKSFCFIHFAFIWCLEI